MEKKQAPTGLGISMLRTTGIQLFMIFLLMSSAMANGFAQINDKLDQKISIAFNKTQLKEALSQISERTGIKLTYNQHLVTSSQFVSQSFTNKRVGDILETMLAPLGIGYFVLDNQVILRKKETPTPLSGEDYYGQQLSAVRKSISGTISGENDQPLPGASVTVKGTTNIAISNEEGLYNIALDDPHATLVFSLVGYITQEVMADTLSVIDIKMQPQVNSLKEVVIVGYGSQSRGTITSAVSKMDKKALDNVPYANAASALQGMLAGVQVQTISGQPGAAPRIIVRGGTSINNPNGAAPLYIIDGVIRSDMNDISTDDIESIQVLKDAASTAIYGARASNGVVIIGTKTGKSGKMQVIYSSDLTLSEVGKKYDMASAREYVYLGRIGLSKAARYTPSVLSRLTLPAGYGTGNDLTNNTAFTTQYLTPQNAHKLQEGWDSMPDPLDPSKTLIFKETNFQDLIYQRAVSQNHHISASGKTDKAAFSAGLGYMTNEGTAITTKYDRLSFNLNSEFKLLENLNVFGRVMYTQSSNNEVYSLENIFYRSAGTPPTAKYTFEDGSLAPGQSRSIGNPVYYLNNDINKNTNENLTLAIGGRLKILPGLSFEPQASLYKVTRDGYSFIPSYYNGPTTYDISRQATASYSKMLQKQLDAVFTYDQNFGSAHHIEAKAGFSYFDKYTYSLNASGQGAATDLIPTLNASTRLITATSQASNQAILGYFSRISYDYEQKYLFNLNARYDAASNLGADNRWGFFPGVSAGWNVHNERFWRALPQDLVRLKLRASYGVNGNISGLSDFQSQGEYSVGQSYGGNSAIQNSIIPNPSLQWEQSKTFDVGFDVGLFNSRINILFDYYNRRTDNLLTSFNLPPSTGFPSIYTNLGSLQNRGIELEINASVLSPRSPVKWNVSFNAARTKNKVLHLPPNGTENNRIDGVYTWDPATRQYAWMGGLQEGRSIGDIYYYKVEGIYKTDEEAKAGPVNTLIPGNDKTSYGGYVHFLDADNNGLINSMDQVYLGNYYPLWNGGLSNSVSYKNLHLFIRLDYTTGHSIVNYAARFLNNNSQGDVNMTKDMAVNSWKNPGDVATMPQYIFQQSYNQPGYSSTYIEKGDFLAIRELTLGYNLPVSLLRKIRINSARINVTGTNLHYFTGYKGLNPEEGGTDNGRYPVPKNLTFGLSVSF